MKDIIKESLEITVSFFGLLLFIVVVMLLMFVLAIFNITYLIMLAFYIIIDEVKNHKHRGAN